MGVGTPPHPGPLTDTAASPRVEFPGVPVSANNNNVNLMRLGDRYFATTDRDVLVEWEPEQLATVGNRHAFAFDDKLSPKERFGNVVSQSAAHSQYDPHTGEHFNYVQNPIPALYDGGVTHTFYAIRPNATHAGSITRSPLATIRTKKASFAHSLGLSGGGVLWFEQPFLMRIIRVVEGYPVAEAMEDKTQEVPTTLHRIDRATGAVAAWVAPEGFCVYHHSNSFEFPNGSIAVDFVRHESCSLMSTLYLDTMLHQPDVMTRMMAQGQLSRCLAHPGATSLECWPLNPVSAALVLKASR